MTLDDSREKRLSSRSSEEVEESEEESENNDDNEVEKQTVVKQEDKKSDSDEVDDDDDDSDEEEHEEEEEKDVKKMVKVKTENSSPIKRKRQSVIDSDDEDDDEEAERKSEAEKEGDDEDSDSSDEDNEKIKRLKQFSDQENEERHDDDDEDDDVAMDNKEEREAKRLNQLNELGLGDDDIEDEDENEEEREVKDEVVEEEAPLVTRIEVEIPKIQNDLGNEVAYVKLPNFLSVDTHPYDPSWYEDEIDEDEILDDEGRARLKLKVESTARWRTVVDENGVSKRESNTRIVKWSDGTMSLHLGSEIFDIHKHDFLQGDNNHLFIRQGTGLLGQAIFKTKLTFRPHSTDSFTHRKMTLSLAEKSHKTQKIRVIPNVGKDPEAHRSEMIKKEEDRLKASIRRENKMRRVRERANIRGPTASYLEPDGHDEEADDGTISLSAIKNKFKKGNYSNIYTDSESSDDDSDLDISNKKKITTDGKRKAAKIEESDDED